MESYQFRMSHGNPAPVRCILDFSDREPGNEALNGVRGIYSRFPLHRRSLVSHKCPTVNWTLSPSVSKVKPTFH